MYRYGVLIDEKSAFRIYNMALIGFSIFFFIIATNFQVATVSLDMLYLHMLCGAYSALIFLNFSYISDRLSRGDVLTLILDPPRVKKLFGLGMVLVLLYVTDVAIHDFATVFSIPSELILFIDTIVDIYVIYFMINLTIIFGTIIYGIYLLMLIGKLYEYASKLPLETTTQQVLLYIGLAIYVICTFYAIAVPYKVVNDFYVAVKEALIDKGVLGRADISAIAGKNIIPEELPTFIVIMLSERVDIELVDRKTFDVKIIRIGRPKSNIDHTVIFNPERYMIGDITVYS